MWSLRMKEDGTFYLTFDRLHRYTNSLRGIWEWVGSQGMAETARAVRLNERRGYLCANDDEGAVRVLVLTD
jgi:hypothetical protein